MSSFDDVKEEVAQILEIENNDYWEIVSSNPKKGLYLVHYRNNADKNKYGRLRGTVVDILAKTIVCSSFGFTPIINQEELSLTLSGDLHVTDIYGNDHQFPLKEAQIKPGFEGTILRVFKHDGIVYHSTHRRLNGDRSRWGNSPTFLQMYRDLHGPSDEFLFDSSYSPYCYIFLLVHPAVLIATKQNVGPGYIVYLGHREMYSPNPKIGPYRQSLLEKHFDPSDERPDAGYINPEVAEIPTMEMPSVITQPFIYTPNDLTLEEANHFLHFGFYQEFEDQLDPRLGLGEFVIIYYYQEGELKLLKIQGEAYGWRTAMRDNNPNLYNQLFLLLNGAHLQTENPDFRQQYLQLYPLLTPYSREEIAMMLEEGPILVWPQTDQEIELNTQEERFHNIWQGYLMSVPLWRQAEVLRLSEDLYRDRDQVIRWLIRLDEADDLAHDNLSRRAKQLIEQARLSARDKTMNNQAYGIEGNSGNQKTISTLTHENLRKLIFKEEGGSLYRLVKESKLEE